jgi:uncharacterized phage protein (TIGR02218 family)
MKDIDPQVLARLDAPVATRVTCWRLTRRDGAVFGFTDHDREIAFDGTVYRPELGFEAGATTLEPDFAAGSAEVAGILSSNAIGEADLAAGLWDGGRVEIHAVDWRAPDNRVLLRRATIGEVSRAGGAFRAELRGLAHLFDAPQGRVFSHLCDADLGDGRCRAELSGAGMVATATLSQGGAADRPKVAGVASVEADWFAGGRLEILEGGLAGVSAEIVSDREVGEVRRLALMSPLAGLPPAGTAVRLTAGCDKRFATCRAKFSNHLNFQGFPHMPGSDRALAYPSRGAAENDGGVLVR